MAIRDLPFIADVLHLECTVNELFNYYVENGVVFVFVFVFT